MTNHFFTANVSRHQGMLQGLRPCCYTSYKQAALTCSQAGHLQGSPSRGVGASSWQPSASAEQCHSRHHQLRGPQGAPPHAPRCTYKSTVYVLLHVVTQSPSAYQMESGTNGSTTWWLLPEQQHHLTEKSRRILFSGRHASPFTNKGEKDICLCHPSFLVSLPLSLEGIRVSLLLLDNGMEMKSCYDWRMMNQDKARRGLLSNCTAVQAPFVNPEHMSISI